MVRPFYVCLVDISIVVSTKAPKRARPLYMQEEKERTELKGLSRRGLLGEIVLSRSSYLEFTWQGYGVFRLDEKAILPQIIAFTCSDTTIRMHITQSSPFPVILQSRRVKHEKGLSQQH